MSTSIVTRVYQADARIYADARPYLFVNDAAHRPPRLRFFLPGSLVTNASPLGSSSTRSPWSGRTA